MTSEEEKRREEENKQFLKRLIESEAETRTDLPAEPKEEKQPDSNATTKASPPRRTPPKPHIALDENNMPLPRRVDELDLDGTRVSPVAYEPPSRPKSAQTRLVPPIQQSPVQPPISGRGIPLSWKSGWGGCLVRGFLISLFGLILLLILGGSIFLYSYYSIARTLPSVEDLQNRASQFETTRILDRNGNPLYDILDPSAGRRTYVTLDRISPVLLAATIATEDKDFYSHPGFDPWAISRALWENYRTGGQGGGASTITQ